MRLSLGRVVASCCSDGEFELNFVRCWMCIFRDFLRRIQREMIESFALGRGFAFLIQSGLDAS